MIKQLLGKGFFWANGWTFEHDPSLWSDKQVVIGFPHTTNMDAIRAVALFNAIGLQTNTLIKKELFKGPLGPVLKQFGAIPVDRQSASQVVEQMAEEFKARERFTLILAPEGTRGKGQAKPPIRTGFWHIAKAANVPIVLMLSDLPNKKGRFLGKIMPSDMSTDLAEIQRLYAQAGIMLELPKPRD